MNVTIAANIFSDSIDSLMAHLLHLNVPFYARISVISLVVLLFLFCLFSDIISPFYYLLHAIMLHDFSLFIHVLLCLIMSHLYFCILKSFFSR